MVSCVLLVACGPGLGDEADAADTDATTSSTGTSTGGQSLDDSGGGDPQTTQASGSSDDGGSSGSTGGDDGGPPVADNPCWTSTRTAFGPLDAVLPGPTQVLAIGSDGLLVERNGQWVFDEALDTSADELRGVPDDLWIRDGAALSHYDGAQLSTVFSGMLEADLASTPSGELWFASASPLELYRRTPGVDAWVAHPAPALGGVTAIAVTDDERWVMDDTFGGAFFAHQVDEGPWDIEEPELPLSFFYPVEMTIGDDGALWLAATDGNAEPTYVIRRAPDGAWSWASFPTEPGDGNVVSLAVVDGHAYAVRRNSTALWRWDGVGPAVHAADLPSAGIMVQVDDRVLAYDNAVGPTIDDVELGAAPSVVALYDRVSVDGGVLAARSVDHVFGGSGTTIHEWSDEVWDVRASVGSQPTAGFFGAWADSPDTAWVTQSRYENSAWHSWIWRVQNGQADIAFDMLPSGTQLSAMWGRGPDEVWAVGQRNNEGAIWAFDGQSWSEDALPVGEDRLVDITGDDERRWVLDARGVVHVDDGTGWDALPALPRAVSEGDIAVAGDDLLVAYEYVSESPAGGAVEDYFEVWDGTQWSSVAARWPDAPPLARAVSPDGLGGVWVLSQSDPPELLYMYGGAWQRIDAPEPLSPAALVGTPDGAVLQASYLSDGHTRVYRWSCD